MKPNHAYVANYLRRTGLAREALAKLVHCSVADIDAALVGKPLMDAVRENFALFKERREKSLLAYSEGWDVLTKHGDEIWHQLTTER